MDKANARPLIPHVVITGRSQCVETTIHFFFVVGLLVSVDGQERSVSPAPPPNDVAAVIATVGHDVTILHTYDTIAFPDPRLRALGSNREAAG